MRDVLAGLPAVMIVGPRASGKTTTARRFATTTVRLDREVEAGPFRDDPDAVLRSLEQPILLDEWQLVPGVLGSVKRAVDDGTGNGRFILTGSARAEMLEATWAATGRVVRLTQWGLCQREIEGNIAQPSFFDRVLDGALEHLTISSSADLRDHVDLALRGGFAEVATQPSEPLRRRWLAAYVDQLLGRDAAIINEQRDPVRLRRYLVALAANTAGIVEHKSIYDAAGITRATATAYDALLELLFVTERIPAWHSNRLSRLTRSPKRYLIEPALMGSLLGVDARAVIRNGDLLGRLIDTFVVNQLRPEADCSDSGVRLSHLRLDTGRREVDVIAEFADGRIAGIEIKSTGAPTTADATHLAWLASELGPLFVCGIVFHTGPRVIRLGVRIYGVPIAALWETW